MAAEATFPEGEGEKEIESRQNEAAFIIAHKIAVAVAACDQAHRCQRENPADSKVSQTTFSGPLTVSTIVDRYSMSQQIPFPL